MTKLPTPVTTTDEYLAAVFGELQKMNQQLAKMQPETAVPEPGTVKLKEPAKKTTTTKRRRKATKKAA